MGIFLVAKLVIWILFLDWLRAREMDENFESFEEQVLSDSLRRFYAEMNNRNGSPYSKSAMIGIRSGINRQIQGPPHNRSINIVTDRVFMAANKVFTGRMRVNRKSGLDISKHKTAIAPGDVKKLYENRVFSADNPTSLQYKVFFEICLHFGRRGREGLAALKKSDIDFVKDDENSETEYATLRFNECTKKNHGTETNQTNKDQRMYSQNNDPNCPVKSLKLYLAKLNPEEDHLFQVPKKPQKTVLS